MARRPPSILDIYSAELPFATEFRRLLQRMRSNSVGAGRKSYLLTSAVLSEGKSTVCSFLAVTAAQLKEMKTLVVDADLRRPSIHRFFGLERAGGLSEVLSQGESTLESVRQTSLDNLSILTAGRASKNPSDVFDAEAIGRLVDELKFYYDLILVDCPPVLPVSDPMLLAPKLDGIVLVVKAGETQQEVVQRAVSILDTSQQLVLGVVLNNMNNSLPFYYDYKYYSYSTPEGGDKPVSKASRPSRVSKRRRSPDEKERLAARQGSVKKS